MFGLRPRTNYLQASAALFQTLETEFVHPSVTVEGRAELNRLVYALANVAGSESRPQGTSVGISFQGQDVRFVQKSIHGRARHQWISEEGARMRTRVSRLEDPNVPRGLSGARARSVAYDRSYPACGLPEWHHQDQRVGLDGMVASVAFESPSHEP